MKWLFIIFGSISLILGIIGIFIPLLPTTPFLLLTATLWAHSTPQLYNRLLSHRKLGSYIRNFREYHAIPLRAKIVSVSLLWATILYCIFGPANGYLWLQLLLAAIAIGVTWHILSFATLHNR
ncbi:MAG: DUF454 domain-containing protein [Rikenellaceae bacterium]|nr:DUF454 domain-containing protein [Rikenellaceae bacterium]